MDGGGGEKRSGAGIPETFWQHAQAPSPKRAQAIEQRASVSFTLSRTSKGLHANSFNLITRKRLSRGVYL